MTPLMPEFRHQLTTAAAQRHTGGRFRRAGAIAPAALVALIALAIAAGAVLALRHHADTRAPAAQAASAPATVAQGRRELKAELGVLRDGRPAALSPTLIPPLFRPIHGPKGTYRPGHSSLDAPLVRAVRLGAYRVGILPARWHPSGRRRASEGLVATFDGPGIDGVPPRVQRRDPTPQWSSPIPVTPAQVAQRGLIVDSEVGAGVDRGAIVVPDGVIGVRLTALELLPTRQSGSRAVPIQPVTDQVHDNVAPLRIGGLTLKQLGLPRAGIPGRFYLGRPAKRSCRFAFVVYGMPARARMTWLKASGAPATVMTRLTLYVTTNRPVTPRADLRACRALKRAHR